MIEGDWDDDANWSNGFPNGPDEIACVDPSGSVLIDDSGTSGITLRALYVDDGDAVSVDPNASLLVNGPDTSVVDGTVHVHGATFGGVGTVVVNGLVEFGGDAVLTSVPAASGAAWGGAHGTLDVPGSLEVGNGGLSLRTCYRPRRRRQGLGPGRRVHHRGLVIFTTIAPGGSIEFQSDGGYYQGSPVAGQSLGLFVNGGSVLKTGGTPGVRGRRRLQPDRDRPRSGSTAAPTLALCRALPSSPGSVAAGMSLGTAACGTGATAVCSGSPNPAVDVMSVTFQVPRPATPVTRRVSSCKSSRSLPTTHRLPRHRQRRLRPR